MKKVLPYLLFLTGLSTLNQATAQNHLGYVLEGDPLNIDKWVLSPNAQVAGTDLTLLQNVGGQSSYIYYDQVTNLTKCEQFDVDFEFRTNNSAINPTEGLAFWYSANLPNGYQAGSGIGLPTNLDGFAAIIDAFDNDNNANNPLLSLRRFTGNNYVEGSTTGQVGPDVPLPAAVVNGVWHQFRLQYRNGQVEIFIDNFITPVFAGTMALSPAMMGYFGISTANSANNISTVSIKNYAVKSYPLPPEVITPIFCENKPLAQFVYPNAGTVYWYNTKVSNDNTGSIAAPVIDVSDTGTYTWYVSRRENQCFGERQELVIKVHKTPVADFDFTKSEGCGADTVTFTNNSEFANSYVWDFNDGYTSIVMNPTHVFDGEGTFNVALIATNEFCADTARNIVKLENPFVVDFDISDDSVCVNEPISLFNKSRVSDKNGIPTKYHWSFGRNAGDTSLGLRAANQTYLEAGYYPVTLTVTNGIPCTDSMTKYVLVDPNPELKFLRSDTIICAGDDIIFTSEVSNEGLTGYTWNFGDGSTLIENAPVVQRGFNTPGTYTVSLDAKYRVCSDSTYSQKVHVRAIPNIYLGPDRKICANGTPVYLTDNENGMNFNATWKWNNGFTGSQLTVTEPGVYVGTVTINNCSASDEVIVTKGCYIDIPNAFSPNGDGSNDFFFPRNSSDQNIKEFSMKVYDRWGQLVFETNRIDGKGWDGTYGGTNMPFGVYVYQVDVVFANDLPETYNGNVTLVR